MQSHHVCLYLDEQKTTEAQLFFSLLTISEQEKNFVSSKIKSEKSQKNACCGFEEEKKDEKQVIITL